MTNTRIQVFSPNQKIQEPEVGLLVARAQLYSCISSFSCSVSAFSSRISIGIVLRIRSPLCPSQSTLLCASGGGLLWTTSMGFLAVWFSIGINQWETPTGSQRARGEWGWGSLLILPALPCQVNTLVTTLCLRLQHLMDDLLLQLCSSGSGNHFSPAANSLLTIASFRE